MTRRWPGLALTTLCCLPLASAAHADGGWVLWARTCDVKSQTCGGEWQRRQTYEAERWCRAARANFVNQALTPEGQKTVAKQGTVVDYQCLPDSADPRGPKGSK
jgi:hypothetical protein